MKRTPLTRKTPLRRKTPLKAKPTPWRRSAENKQAKAEAFAPFTREDGWVMCVFCKRYFPPRGQFGITESHIKSAGGWDHIKQEALNKMPNCWACHDWYENLTEEEQMAEVEKIFPGREEELLALARSKSVIA
jgi:hypothetical protein